MATDSFNRPATRTVDLAGNRLTANDIAHAIVAPLASLRLTVVLLVLAILVTFIATLDQTRADVYDIKMKHFRSVFVAVPFQTFFVPAWAPSFQNVQGRFWVPSGLSILVLMLINLTAAHTLRFKLKARGKNLLIGIIAAVIAALVTWAVIFNNQNADGFQAKPPISYELMWILLQVGMLLISLASLVSAFLIDSGRKVERYLLISFGVVCGLVLAVTVFLGESAFIGDSAMRILWQLAQATVAAIVGYFACLLLFHRKAGMVLLHLGVAGLMLNEIFVTVTNNEQRMTIFEGEQSSTAFDIRATEMAIIDMSDPEFDQITTVPSGLLKAGNRISDPNLPFDIQPVKYMAASDLQTIRDPSTNLATAGIGLIGEAIPVPATAGTDSEQVADFASAYVELLDRESGESLGVYLISQALAETKADSVKVEGKEYRIQLRFKTEYKPYALTLVDATRVNYVGTEIPKYYGSDVVINDFNSGLETDQTIFMNEPLRYANETFYQSGMDTGPNGKQFSTFQIVTNVGWMIPYVCCMLTVVGLVAQFGESLLGFLKKQRAKAEASVAVADFAHEGDQLTTEQQGRSWLGWLPAAVLTGIFGLWALGNLSGGARQVKNEDMRLDLLAQVPVTFEGRVQPLGSFAINTARQLRERESLSDGNDEKQPAIRWLADLAFGVESASDYRTFRITDPTVINALGLPKGFTTQRERKKFIYTVDEVYQTRQKLAELIPDPREKNKKLWTQLESRLGILGQKVQQLMALQRIFGAEEFPTEDWLLRLQNASMQHRSVLTPLVVPQDQEESPWLSMTTAQSRAWLKEIADELDVNTTTALAQAMVEQKVLPLVRDDMIRDRIIQRLLSVPEFREAISKRHLEADPQRLAELMKQSWDELPKDLLDNLVQAEGPLVDALLAQQSAEFAGRLESEMLVLTGDQTKLEFSTEDNGAFELLQKLGPAYREGDAKTFNSTLEAYLAAVQANPPREYSQLKMTTERYYNSLMPFYVSLVIYVAVFLIAATSWFLFQQPLGKAAMWLLALAASIQFIGILMRLVISGRPPVTNLYSSVLFVSLVGVLFYVIFERMTRMRIGTALAGLSGFLALLWAYSMTVIDGDTFTVMVAVLDTSFWLATHVVCISLGYAATFVAGLLGVAYIIAGMLTDSLSDKTVRKRFINVMYGFVCFGLLASFFGTVLGGLWGDDSWGRFWGWDPKENGALMIVLGNAVVLHARWGGMVRERGLAALAALSNIIVLWSWKGVNALGVGLHAYAGTEDNTLKLIVMVGLAHLLIAGLAFIPTSWWMSFQSSASKSKPA